MVDKTRTIMWTGINEYHDGNIISTFHIAFAFVFWIKYEVEAIKKVQKR